MEEERTANQQLQLTAAEASAPRATATDISDRDETDDLRSQVDELQAELEDNRAEIDHLVSVRPAVGLCVAQRRSDYSYV